MECGSACSSATRRSRPSTAVPPPDARSGAIVNFASRAGCPFLDRSAENLVDALKRNRQPIGAIIQFVTQLVDSLVEQKGIEQNSQFFAIPRDIIRLVRDLQVFL